MVVKTWDYIEKNPLPEQFPELAGVPGLEPFVVTEFSLPARRRVYLSNGVIGLRLPAIPFLGADVAVNGLVGRTVENGVEGLAPAPFPIAADIMVGKDRLSERSDLVHMICQSLNMSFGELTTQFEFETDLAKVNVEVFTFASRSLPTAICQEITIVTDSDCEMIL